MHKAVAALAALASAHGVVHAVAPDSTYTYRVLSNPTSGDAFLFRNAIHDNANQITAKVFTALQSLLGGQAPTVNFVLPDQTGDSTMLADPATNSISMNPMGVESLTNANSPYHSSAFTSVPHELAHLRQLVGVFNDNALREGGAQAFADVVTPSVAQQTNTPYVAGNYDGNYAPLVQAVQKFGQPWILGGQFGRPAPPSFP